MQCKWGIGSPNILQSWPKKCVLDCVIPPAGAITQPRTHLFGQLCIQRRAGRPNFFEAGIPDQVEKSFVYTQMQRARFIAISHSHGRADDGRDAWMYRVTRRVGDYILLTSIWLFWCLPNYAWAAANMAELAWQHGGTPKSVDKI